MIRRGLLFTAPLYAMIAALSAYGWIVIPADASLPVHWNIQGDADRYSSKTEALLIIPIIAVAISGLFIVLPTLDPRRENIQRSPTPFLVGWVGVLGLLTTVHAVLVLTATGVVSMENASPVRLTLAAASLLLLAAGNVLPKARSNWFVGVRNSWTLSSEYSWEKSQRLGGRLLVAAGAVSVIGATTLPIPAAIALLLLTTIGGAIASTVMSYIWWKRDPARRTGG